jgi:hypothetical protein
MKVTVQKVTQLLDGQPTMKKGQSLVEMALISPLLILMVLGLVEIGFLANYYMVLLDAVRTGGRAAVNLDPLSFPAWDTANNDGARNQQRMDCDKDTEYMVLLPGTAGTNAHGARQFYNVVTNPSDPFSGAASGFKDAPRGGSVPGAYNGGDGAFGFFDEIACQVTLNMQSAIFNDDDATSKDDIVVSAISYARIDYKNSDGSWKFGAPYTGTGSSYTTGPATRSDTWVTVTGRYPLENRFCGYSDVGSTWKSGDIRDPFNYKTSDKIASWSSTSADAQGLNTADTYEGIHYNVDGTEDSANFYILDLARAKPLTPPVSPNHNQGVRGFVFSGNHKNYIESGSTADDCYGSAFRVQDIEQRLNLDSTWNPHVPNGGLVIVEVFWQYHPLYFGPLFEGFSNDKTRDPVIHVWGWFLVPGAEPTETPSS